MAEDTDEPQDIWEAETGTTKRVPALRQFCYEWTPTTFTKILFPRELCPGGNRRWARERIMNEATALKLVRQYTNIPVPDLIGVGDNEDGSFYVKTSFIPNPVEVMSIPLSCSHASEAFWGKPSKNPVPGKYQWQVWTCESCKNQAEKNADDFIRDVVLPELKKIPKECNMGLNGTVIPPPFVCQFDERPHWPVKTSTEPVFSFLHGDLGPNNILCDRETLLPVAVIDWEYAGFFPEICTSKAYATGYKDDYYKMFGQLDGPNDGLSRNIGNDGLFQYIHALTE